MLSKRKMLAELPKRIELSPDEFGLKNVEYNYRVASSILKHPQKTLVETYPRQRNLYRYQNRFILIDEESVMVLYYLSWKEEFFKILNTTVTTEVLHWRNRGQTMMGFANLTRHVFFDLLLPLRGAVLSDSLHTPSGEAFWVKIIEESFDRNLGVYYLNFLPVNTHVNREIIQLHDKNDFLDLTNPTNSVVRAPWGGHEKFEARRFLILDRTQTSVKLNP